MMRTIGAVAVAAMLAMSAGAAVAAERNIVETAKAEGKFSKLLEVAGKAGIVDRLKASGPYTLFAPTDAAFEAMRPGLLAELMKPENKEDLVALIEHHIVPGKVLAIDVRKAGGKTIATADGSKLSVTGDAALKVDEAKVVQADVLASNGVIHVIDKVMTPEL